MNKQTRNSNEQRWQQILQSKSLRDHIKEYEGDEEHPYLDTKGIITIGVGFNVNTESGFKALPWQFKRPSHTLRPATAEEIAAGYRLMQRAREKQNGKFNFGAARYDKSSNLRLPDEVIRSLI